MFFSRTGFTGCGKRAPLLLSFRPKRGIFLSFHGVKSKRDSSLRSEYQNEPLFPQSVKPVRVPYGAWAEIEIDRLKTPCGYCQIVVRRGFSRAVMPAE